MKDVEILLKNTIKPLLVCLKILLKISIRVMKPNFNKKCNFIEMVFTY